MVDTAPSWDDDGYYDASFGVCKCRRYHAKLRDFYQGAYNWTMAANAFGASGAFVAVLGSQGIIAGILTGAVALASLFESIFKYESRARVHHELCLRIQQLMAISVCFGVRSLGRDEVAKCGACSGQKRFKISCLGEPH